MSRVFITRTIPDAGVALLRDKGYEVDVSPLDRPMTNDELIAALRAKPYDAVLCLLSDAIDSAVFDAAPTVKVFANYAIGFDNFDVQEGKKRGVYLSNTPHGGVDRVAEHAWALILALTCRVVDGDRYMRAGKYTGWDPMLLPGIKVRGLTLGLVGAGHIGMEVAQIGALGFGMPVVYFDVVRNPKVDAIRGVEFVSTVEDVLRRADVISLHVPLNGATRHIINTERLKLMKRTAYIVNTSRGPVIDEAALVEALKAGTIAGAGLDVFENEPLLTPGLSELSNVVLTPHIASSTLETRQEMAEMAATDIIDVLEGGKPRDMVYN